MEKHGINMYCIQYRSDQLYRVEHMVYCNEHGKVKSQSVMNMAIKWHNMLQSTKLGKPHGDYSLGT